MIAQELEVTLHTAFVEARKERHEFLTVEHLLLALLDNPSATEDDDENATASVSPSVKLCMVSATMFKIPEIEVFLPSAFL